MTQLLKSSWLVPLTGCLLYLATTFALITPAKFQGVMAALAATTHSPEDDPSWKFRNPEMEQWLSEIKQEKEALALREQQAGELEARVKTEQKELSVLMQSMNQLQADFDKKVIQYKGQEGENFKRQAKLLSAMSPETAAAMLNEMSDTDAVKLLYLMKTDQVSLLLETLSKMGKGEMKRAAAFTERLRQVIPPVTSNP